MNTEIFRMMVKNSATRRRNAVFGTKDIVVCEEYTESIKGRIQTPRKRDIRVERQTPPLSASDVEKMKAIYFEARTISLDTGITHHVDHICPVAKGGAHHWLNMAIVPARANLSKGAKWNGVDGYTYQQLI